MTRVFNFSAGPAVLPLAVLEEAQHTLLEYPGAGMSVLEMSHRSKPFEAIIQSAEARIAICSHSDNSTFSFYRAAPACSFRWCR
jgi:phosphoserine aminotransferase